MEGIHAFSNALADLIEATGRHVVRVDARRRLSASGVVWSADGVIVTAHHVVRRNDAITVGLPDGKRVEATLIGRDPTSDLAVLKADATDLAVPSWVGADDLRVGHFVLAAARPRHSVQATHGIVSGLGAPFGGRGPSHGTRFVRTDVLMYPGFSGGPLVTTSGALAGLNTSALRPGVSIAVPAATVAAVVETLLAHGRMPKGYLGVGLQPVRLPEAMQSQLTQETGLMIMSVEADGPAAAAGIVQGDVLVALDGEATPHIDALEALLGSERVGQTVTTKLIRSGSLQELDLAVGQAE
jgi:S1-C subfamily serine protease